MTGTTEPGVTVYMYETYNNLDGTSYLETVAVISPEKLGVLQTM